MFEKYVKEEKIYDWMWAALNLQPSDLCSNAYRSLPGSQDVFFLLFTSIYIHRNISE